MDFSVLLTLFYYLILFFVIKLKLDLERKLRIENLTRCMNCEAFVTCGECEKENVVECSHYREIPPRKQVVVVGLSEWCKDELERRCQ